MVAEIGGAHLGDGQATGGYHQSGRAEFAGIGEDDESGIALDFSDFAFGENLDLRGVTFGFEHVGDFGGGAIAEELAQCFFVIRDAVFFDEGDEIGGGVTRQSGFGEVGIGGKKVFRLAMKVCEVAAASARDQDFFANAVGMFEEGDEAPAFCGFDSAHQSRGTGAKNKDIEFGTHGRNGDGRSLIFKVVSDTTMVTTRSKDKAKNC